MHMETFPKSVKNILLQFRLESLAKLTIFVNIILLLLLLCIKGILKKFACKTITKNVHWKIK